MQRVVAAVVLMWNGSRVGSSQMTEGGRRNSTEAIAQNLLFADSSRVNSPAVITFLDTAQESALGTQSARAILRGSTQIYPTWQTACATNRW